MKLKSYFTLIVLALIFIAGCKKDNDSNPIDAGQLTGKTWKLTAETVSPAVDLDSDGDVETDSYAQLGACETDNLFTFSTASVITRDEAATKCDISDPQTITGTWAWVSNQTKLHLNFGGDTITLPVLSLSSTTMVFQGYDTVDITPITVTSTLTAQ